jgi:hypothetical protein
MLPMADVFGYSGGCAMAGNIAIKPAAALTIARFIKAPI